MGKSSFQTVVRLAVGIGLVAIALHTWLMMGLVVPVTVSGSSMAPALNGPNVVYRCIACASAFSVGLDQATPEMAAVCPQCGRLVGEAEFVNRVGDRLLVDRTSFGLRGPRRWEVVVFRSPVDEAALCVKRVVGLPGETVALVDGEVFVDGTRLAVPSGRHYQLRYGDHDKLREGWRLGAAEYFVLGDNAEISDDGRNWATGPGLDAKLLVGKPLGVR